MTRTDAASEAAVTRVARRVALAMVLVTGCGATAAAQARNRVQLSLREVSAASVSCALDVTSNSMVGEAILTCQRTSPDSHLGAHRALTVSEAARLFALTEQMQVRPQPPEDASVPRPVGPKTTLVVRRGVDGLTVDLSPGSTGLSDAEREISQMLRSIADELRGVKR